MLRRYAPALAREFRLLPHHLDHLHPEEAAFFVDALAASFDPPAELSEEEVKSLRRAAATRARAIARYLRSGHGASSGLL